MRRQIQVFPVLEVTSTRYSNTSPVGEVATRRMGSKGLLANGACSRTMNDEGRRRLRDGAQEAVDAEIAVRDPQLIRQHLRHV